MGRKFVGVYPLNRLPQFLKPGCYVINTQTSELPGEHWIAVYVECYKIKVFDSYGFFYPDKLVNTLQRLGRKIHYNRRQYQRAGEIN
jgi:hypothetical protein